MDTPYQSDLPTIKDQLLAYIKDNPDASNRDIYVAFSLAQLPSTQASIWTALAELLEANSIKYREDDAGYKRWTAR